MKKNTAKAAAALMLMCMLTACGSNNGAPESSGTYSETSVSDISESTEASAVQTEETSTSQTVETDETAEAAPLSEYMRMVKDIFAAGDDEPLYYQVGAADITGDGVPELFVYCTPSGRTGYMDIYDVANGGAKLGTLHCNCVNGDVCTDENGEYHLIVCDDYFFSTNTQYTAYFDLHFSGGETYLTVPLLSVVYSWFEDSGEHCFVDRYYRDCTYAGSYDPDDVEFFDLEQNEHHYCGYTMYEDNFIVQAELEDRETEEIAQIIEENVYDGLKKQYEVEIITGSMTAVTAEEFYEYAEEYLKDFFEN